MTDKEAILQETLGLLEERYSIGLYEYLYKHCPELYKQLLELENRIDHTYLDPYAPIDQLKAVLREYWTFHITAIREFRQTGQLDLDLSHVRQKMTEERVRA